MTKLNWAFAAGKHGKHLAPGEPAVPGQVHEFVPGFTHKFLGLDEDDSSELAKLKFARMGVIGEGSCAFHSICVALNLEDYVHRTEADKKKIAYAFRCSFGKKLTKDKLKEIVKRSKGKSPMSLEEAKEAFCDPKVWADEMIIRWVSESLDMNLIFLDLDKRIMYCGVHHDNAISDDDIRKLPTTIIVLWVNHQHFEPLVRIVKSDKHTSTLQALYMPAESEEDAKIIGALMRKYRVQCKL